MMLRTGDLQIKGNRILVRKRERFEETKIGSLFIPDTILDKARPQQGVVVAVSSDVKDVKPGEVVVFGYGTGVDVSFEEGLLTFVDRSSLITKLGGEDV